jgi:hypothetical protein
MNARLLLLVPLLVFASGCDPTTVQTLHEAGFARTQTQAAVNAQYPAPASRVSIDLNGSPASLWPYTGEKLDGNASDPVNLIFAGEADPVAVRNASWPSTAIARRSGSRRSLRSTPAGPTRSAVSRRPTSTAKAGPAA